MSKPPTKKPAKPKAPKIAKPKSVGVLIRLPEPSLERLDILAAGSGISRNAAAVKAIDAWKAKPPAEPDAGPAIGSRLDKTTIGRRIGPKKGAKFIALADDSEEGV